MTILHPEVPEEEISGDLERISGYISGAGGTVTETLRESPWGRRRLAYAIRHGGRDLRDGYYTVFHFELAPSRVGEVEREIKLNDRIIRYIVTTWEPRQLDAAELEQAEIEAEDAAAAAYAAAQAAAASGAGATADSAPAMADAGDGTAAAAAPGVEIEAATDADAAASGSLPAEGDANGGGPGGLSLGAIAGAIGDRLQPVVEAVEGAAATVVDRSVEGLNNLTGTLEERTQGQAPEGDAAPDTDTVVDSDAGTNGDTETDESSKPA